MRARFLSRLRGLRAGVAWRPEWPLGAAAALAWAVLVVLSGPSHPAQSSAAPVAAGALICPIAPAAAMTARASPYPETSAAGLTLMAVAMMTPATLPAARHVAFNSFRRRRNRAMFLYEAAYLALFVGFSAAVLVVATAYLPASRGPWPLVIMLVVAAAWQLTKWKRRAALSCRRTVPLPPSGARADVACLRFGFLEASRCLRSTWPLMLLLVLAGQWHLPAMAAMTAIMLLEERPAAAALIVKPLAGILVAVAAAVVLGG